MSLIQTIQSNQSKEQRLQFIHSHQNAFDVDSSFILSSFEKAVLEINETCGIEPSCKVEGDRLFAGRFTAISQLGGNWKGALAQALRFLDTLESRVDFEVNRELLHRFLASHLDSPKITSSIVGVDLRPSIEESSVKIHFHVDKEEDAGELAQTALALDGGDYSPELIQALSKDTTLIGFDFFLNGDSEIELYASCPGGKGELSGNWGRDFLPYVRKNFSDKVISLVDVSDMFMVGYSKANPEPVLYFAFFDLKDIAQYFSLNSLGQRIYDFCKSQDGLFYYCLGVNEQDLAGNRLEKVRFYYGKVFDYPGQGEI